MKTLILPIAVLALLIGCSSNGPGPVDPKPGPSEPGPGEGPDNLLAEKARLDLYRDIDNYTQRYMIARSEGASGTWESLHKTVLTPIADKNLPELLGTARGDTDPRFRVIAARGLGFGTDATKIVPVLSGLLRESNANLVSSALVSLYVLGSPNTPIGPLVALLNHDDADVRSNDALALFAVLRARRREGRVPGTDEVRDAAGRLVYIISNLEEDPFVRGHAAAALGAMGDPAATDILINLLVDESSVVRTRAAEGLGQLGQEQAVLPLIDAMQAADSPNEAFVIAAGLGKLAKTRGLYCDAEALGTDAERWRDWYQAVKKP